MKSSLWRRTALVALLLPLLAHAEDSEHEMERAPCQSPQGLFSVVIRSPSGEPVEDDMTVWIEREGKPPLQVDFGGKTAWFELAAGKTKQPWACTGTAAFLTKSGQVIVLLGTDDRPAAQRLSGFVYDVATHTVKSTVFKGPPFIPPLEVVPWRDGLLFHSTFQLDGPFQCKGNCPEVNGAQVTRIDALPLTPWYEMSVEKGRLLPILSLAQTLERHGLGPFFHDDRAFAWAIGHERRTDILKESSYKLALRADGSKCLALKKAGKIRDEPWRCVPPARP